MTRSSAAFEAMPAVAAVDECGTIEAHEPVTVDDRGLGEDLGQDGVARRGRHECEAMTRLEDVHRRTTQPAGAGVAEQGDGGGGQCYLRFCAGRSARLWR